MRTADVAERVERPAPPVAGRKKRNGESEILRHARQVIAMEAEAVAGLGRKLNGQFVRAIELLLTCKGRVIVTGMGKSGIISRKIAGMLNSTGTPAIFLHPAEGAHGDLGFVQRGDVVIAISKSGGTDEVYQLFPVFKRLGVPVITITGNPKSPMAEKSDVVLDVSVAEEACPNDLVPTSSSTAALVMGDALAVVLLAERHFSPEEFALLHPGGSLGKKLLLKVADLMHTGDQVPKVSLNTPVKEAILEMTSKRFGATSVVNGKGELVGVFTDGDLRRLVEKTGDIYTVTMEKAMTKSPKTIDPEALAAAALNKMELHKITQLLVVDGARQPIGIVHLHDLLQAGVV